MITCAYCGSPRDNHPFRHPFVPMDRDDLLERLKQCASGNSSYPQVLLHRGEAKALQAHLEMLRNERDAAGVLAIHLRHCRRCGEMDVMDCADGAPLWTAFDSAYSPDQLGDEQ